MKRSGFVALGTGAGSAWGWEAVAFGSAAEAMAAEVVSAVGGLESSQGPEPSIAARRAESLEPGLRQEAWPHLRWQTGGEVEPHPALVALGQGLPECRPRELDRRMRAAIAFGQRLDFERGRLLRQMVVRGLHRDLGFSELRAVRVGAARLRAADRAAAGAGGQRSGGGQCVPGRRDRAAAGGSLAAGRGAGGACGAGDAAAAAGGDAGAGDSGSGAAGGGGIVSRSGEEGRARGAARACDWRVDTRRGAVSGLRRFREG